MRLILTALALIPVTLQADPLPTETQKKLDEAVRRTMAVSVMPGVIIKIRSPKGDWNKTYGVRDAKTLQPIRPNDHLRIGSNTKTFTGTAVCILQDQGKLKLSDPISKYLPDVPNGDNITIEQLGNMSAGIASYTFDDGFQKAMFSNPARPWTPQELLAYAYKLPPDFAPGKGWAYSNSNFVILGLLIEKVAGKPVKDVFRELIFQPLGLKQTSWDEVPSLPEPFARGYTLQSKDDSLTDATGYNPTWAFTAGQLVSTMDDLVKWAKALGTGALLKPSTWKQRHDYAHVPPNDADNHYGFGMGFTNGWAGHTGELPGYNTSCFYNEKEDIAVAIGVNCDIPVGRQSPSPAIMKAIAGVLTPSNIPKY